jgi:AraC family transcriptional regulator
MQIAAASQSSAFQSNTLIPQPPRSAIPIWKRPNTPNYLGGRLVRQHHRTWSGVGALLIEVMCDGQLDADLNADCTRLSIFLEEVGGRVEIRQNSKQPLLLSPDISRPMSLIPAGMDVWAHAPRVRFVRHLLLQFDDTTLAAMVDEEIDVTTIFAPRLMFSEPRLLHLARLFAHECSNAEPISHLYGDSLSIALLLSLSALSTTEETSTERGGLAAWQMRRVVEYLEAHLAEDVSLETLAGLVQLSRSYFSRAFKVSTGLAPHQWQLKARIAKAKRLLIEGDLSLSHIAIEVGFADQAHFTRTFGRHSGLSPRAWQRFCHARAHTPAFNLQHNASTRVVGQ